MFKLKLVALAAITATSLQAHAAYNNEVDYGDIGGAFSVGATFSHSSGTTFLDKFAFTVTAPINGTGYVVDSTQLPSFNITNLTVTLFGLSSAPGGLVVPVTALPNGGDFAYGGGFYAPGDYYFEIAGTASGTRGGRYTFGYSTTPVPEPATYAMLSAGLGVIGAIAVRRRKKDQQR